MNPALHTGWFWIIAVGLVCGASAAEPPPAKLDLSDPRAAYRTYVNAVRNKDLATAKKCWVFDGDTNSAAVDTMVGLWIAPRRFFEVAQKTFRAEDLPADFEKRQRDDITDKAIDVTLKRLEDAELKITGDTAELRFKWQKDDYPAFEYSDSATTFRKAGGEWKIDANKQTGLKHGADFFKNGSWGPAFRDQVEIMREATRRMEKGELKTVAEMEAFFKNGFGVARQKHEERAALREKD